jgi:fatty acid desaturase
MVEPERRRTPRRRYRLVRSSPRYGMRRAVKVLWALAILLLVVWFFAFAIFHVGGVDVHLIWVLIVIVVTVALITGFDSTHR